MDNIIEWTDERPYHYISMYKNIFQMYLGLQTRLLSNIKHKVYIEKFRDQKQGVFSINTDEEIKVSIPKSDEIDVSYKSCDNPDSAIKVDNIPVINFKSLYVSTDFFIKDANVESPYHILIHEKMLWVVFGVGFKSSFVTLDEAIPQVNDDEDQWDSYRRYLLTFLIKIQEIYEIYKPDTLIICGHSHGMRSATITSFITECMVSQEFAKQHIRINGSFNNTDQDWRMSYDLDELDDEILNSFQFIDFYQYCPCLKSLKRYCIGTGGMPVLFVNEGEFKSYFTQMQGRYAHIVSGVQIGPSVYMDEVCAPTDSLQNYKFQCYYREHEELDSHVKYKYTQCLSPLRKQFITHQDAPIKFRMELHDFDSYRRILAIFFYDNTSKIAKALHRLSVLRQQLKLGMKARTRHSKLTYRRVKKNRVYNNPK